MIFFLFLHGQIINTEMYHMCECLMPAASLLVCRVCVLIRK